MVGKLGEGIGKYLELLRRSPFFASMCFASLSSIVSPCWDKRTPVDISAITKRSAVEEIYAPKSRAWDVPKSKSVREQTKVIHCHFYPVCLKETQEPM